MAKKGFSFKYHRQGGGWNGYMYRRAKAPGNAKALASVRERVHNQCTGIREPAARRTCFAVVAKGGQYQK